MNVVKQCTRCAISFSCGRDAESCWCQALPALPAGVLVAGSDCLCPDCLRVAIAEATADHGAADATTNDPDHRT